MADSSCKPHQHCGGLQRALNDKRRSSDLPRGDDVIQLGNLARVLHPSDPVDQYDNPNNASIVIRLDYGDVSFLFAGDVETLGESEILSLDDSVYELLDVDILKVAHHGSRTSSSEAF